MGKNSKIGWTHHSFNPVVGCTKVSPACDHCYAEAWAKRTGQPQLWAGELRRTSASNWRQPIKWNREALAAGERRRVFCASLADVFDNQWSERWRDDLWHLIDQTPTLDWLLLTKRPQNIAGMLPTVAIGAPPWGNGWPNVWLGTTVENQEEADRRIPHLLAVPSRVRFLSCEPLLGPIDLAPLADDIYQLLSEWYGPEGFDPTGSQPRETRRKGYFPRIQWVIVGGESGHDARPSHPDWFRSLRDQCATAGVAFHFKQWGACLPASWDGEDDHGHIAYLLEEEHCAIDCDTLGRARIVEAHGREFARFGHGRTGRLLDGVLHDAYPVGAR